VARALIGPESVALVVDDGPPILTVDVHCVHNIPTIPMNAARSFPVFGAVGHEPHTTLFARARVGRAPTPTAAAEMAVPVRAELIAQVMDDAARLFNAMRRRLGEDDTRLRSAGRALLDPGRVIEQKAQRLDYAVANADRLVDRWVERGGFRVSDLAARLISPTQRLNLDAARLDGAARGLAAGLRQALRGGDMRVSAMSQRLRLDAVDRRLTDGAARLAEATGRIDPAATRRLDEMARALTQTSRLLDSHSVERVLEKGFVRVDDATGAPLLDAAATRPGQAVTLHFRDGKRAGVIDGAPAPAPAKRRPKSAKDSQESLF
ncbi:MAG: exodeoxyribonuclease VII large subunit, partial [Pseudomonadota bacterium]|nr:exodeoxyribonuclease VII large subunit [Pseudomonadota bacterium]